MVSERALKMGPLEWILLLVLSVLWGGSFFFAKLAVAELPPFTIVTLVKSDQGWVLIARDGKLLGYAAEAKLHKLN